MADTSRGKSVRCSYCNADIYVPRVYRTREVSEAGGQGVVWIRATCACTKVIKAPEEWLGKVGKCPRCRRDLALLDMTPEGESPADSQDKVASEVETSAEPPPPPSRKPKSPASGPAAKLPPGARATDPDSDESSTGSVSGLLDLSGAKDEPLVDELAPDSDLAEARRLVAREEAREKEEKEAGLAEAMAAQMKAQAKAQARAAAAAAKKASVDAAPAEVIPPVPAAPARSLRQRLVIDRPVFAYGFAALLALLAMGNVYRIEVLARVDEHAIWIPPTKPVYFYDLGTGRAFVQPSDQIPPVEPPSKFVMSDDTPGGVRAYFFACGKCADIDNATLGFVESFSKQGAKAAKTLRAAIETNQPAERAREAEAEMMVGHLVGQVEGQSAQWDSVESSMAAVRLSRLNRKCEDGSRPVLCMPPAEP